MGINKAMIYYFEAVRNKRSEELQSNIILSVKMLCKNPKFNCLTFIEGMGLQNTQRIKLNNFE